VLRSDLSEVESELSCGSIFRMNFIASYRGVVVRLHELVELRLRPSSQAAGRRALPCLHLFGFNGFDVTSNDEGSFALTHASRRPPPLASCSTGLPLALLFPVSATMFRVSGRPAPGGCGDSRAMTALEGGCPRAVVVIVGLVADTRDAAREVVQDVVETAATRFQHDPVDVE
jgi:hypothetical protein